MVFELMEVSLSSVEICSSSYLKPGSFSGDLYTVAQTELTQLIRETAPDSTSADYAISVRSARYAGLLLSAEPVK